MKVFTKGQAVTYIVNFDDKGLFVFRQAVVYSCGKKQMVLTDAATGEEMGRHYRPEVGGEHGGTFQALDQAAAIAKCEDLARAYLAKISQFYLEASKNLGFGEAYAEHMAEKLQELGEARGMDYADAPFHGRAQLR